MRSLLLVLMVLLTGCATVDPPARMPASGHVRILAPALRYPSLQIDPIADEVRLLDSRVIRAALRSDPAENAVFLNGPQKTAIIVTSSVVGAYLISEWIEDEVALFPQ